MRIATTRAWEWIRESWCLRAYKCRSANGDKIFDLPGRLQTWWENTYWMQEYHGHCTTPAGGFSLTWWLHCKFGINGVTTSKPQYVSKLTIKCKFRNWPLQCHGPCVTVAKPYLENHVMFATWPILHRFRRECSQSIGPSESCRLAALSSKTMKYRSNCQHNMIF